MCLHTFTVVKTSPASRKASNSLQRLKRNLTILARAFNVTQKFADSPKQSKFGNHCSKDKLASVLDPYLIKAVATNTRRIMLFSKNKYLLQITNDGFVNGTQDVKLPTGKSNVASFFIKLWRKLPIFLNVVRDEGFLDLHTCCSFISCFDHIIII